jgi:hypothetical protein
MGKEVEVGVSLTGRPISGKQQLNMASVEMIDREPGVLGKELCSLPETVLAEVTGSLEEVVIDLVAMVANACWHVQAQVLGCPVKMLVDTGSTYTLLSREVYEGLPAEKRPALCSSRRCLRSANGGLVRVQGEVVLPLCIQTQSFFHHIIVADIGGLSAILGTDFMLMHNVVIDVGRGVMMLEKAEVVLWHHLEDENMVVHISQDVVVPGGQGLMVLGASRVPLPEKEVQWLLQPDEDSLGALGLHLAEGLVQRGDGVPVFLFNPCDDDVEIGAGTIVGCLQEVQLHDPSRELLETRVKLDYQSVQCGGIAIPDIENQTNLSREAPDPDGGDQGDSCCEAGVWAAKSAVTGAKDLPDTETMKNNIVLPAHIQPVVDVLPNDLSEEQRHSVLLLLMTYKDIFAEPEGSLGRTGLVQHTIDVGNARPFRQPPRRTPMAQRPVVEEELEKMLERGVIEPCTGPWSSPIVLVKKKDGSVRFCVDFRRLNDLTHKDAFPLPSITDSLESLAGSRWFSTLDLANGFLQVELASQDREKTGFVTHRGLFHSHITAGLSRIFLRCQVLSHS